MQPQQMPSVENSDCFQHANHRQHHRPFRRQFQESYPADCLDGDAISNFVNKMDEPALTAAKLHLFDQIGHDREKWII
jgi:hypothetical protein